jgi:hypothetical protein
MPSEIEIYGDTALFGIRVCFESDRRETLDAALALYPLHDDAPMQEQAVYIVLETYDVKGIPPDSMRVDGMELSIVRDGIVLQADGMRRRGVCIFPNELPNDDVVSDAINTVAMFLVAQAGRVPVHASAVMFGERAVVLAGRSGAGKSSLALAADRAGYPVLSDDTVFVQTQPKFALWALPQAIHVFEQDAAGQARNGMRFRSGRWKHALPVAAPRFRADQALLCVLARGEDVSLKPIAEADAVAALTCDPEPGYEFYGTRAVDAVRAIARGGTWRLTLSRNPAEAIGVLAAAFAGAAQ